MRFFKEFLIFSFCTVSPVAWAQFEPVDKNVGGGYAGGYFAVGQAAKVGGQSAGPAWLIGIDAGYGVKRDTWNRIEYGFDLGTGAGSFRDAARDLDADVTLAFVGMLKAGFGYSLGNHSFGVLRVGVGLARASLSGSTLVEAIDAGITTGQAMMASWDAVVPMTDSVDFVAGASFRTIQLDFGRDFGPAFQLNIPTAYGGMRLRL